MKVLYLTKYSRNGASSRLRSYQFFPLMQSEGIEVVVSPLFPESYLVDLYSGRKASVYMIFKCYLKRFLVLFTISRYDKIVIEKELFPYFFSWFECLLGLFQVNYIVDYDDAIFHNYDLSKSKLIQFLLGKKIDRVMQYSGCVLVGNSYLAERAQNSGAKTVVIQPTVIDIDKYVPKVNYYTKKIVIGWVGSPTTFKYVKSIRPVFDQLFKKYDVVLHIIGAKEDLGFGDKVNYFDWSEANESLMISKFDIGIMPLENTPWELGKCSYKLIQYMGCGVPVLASAVGMNNEVVKEGKNGFLVTTHEQWLEKLIALIQDQELRMQLGKNGRTIVEKHYSIQSKIAPLITILNS